MNRVFVARHISDAGLELLRPACELTVWPGALPPTPEELRGAVGGCAGILSLLTDRVDAAVMDAAGPSLQVISNLAVGVDNVDVVEASRRGIPVGNTPDVLTETTADMAWTLLMAAARRVVEGDRYVRAGRWRTWEPELLLGKDVYGATLGLVGFGRIGQAVARRATGFGMRVLYTRRQRIEPARPEPVEGVPPLPDPPPPGGRGEVPPTQVDFDTLLGVSDFISIHAPLTPDTRGMFARAAFAHVKRGAILVNTARGPLVESAALYEALSSGQLGAAALDVTDPEPIPPGDPLLDLPNCLIVPHIGSASVQTRSRMARTAAQNLLAGLRGERLPQCANPEVYE